MSIADPTAPILTFEGMMACPPPMASRIGLPMRGCKIAAACSLSPELPTIAALPYDIAGAGNNAFASFTSNSPSSAPKEISSERSSLGSPASGLAMTAQAATRVTEFTAGKPPSTKTTSLQIQMRLISMSATKQPCEVALQYELTLIGRQRIAHELDRMRLAQRERRVASEHDPFGG